MNQKHKTYTNKDINRSTRKQNNIRQDKTQQKTRIFLMTTVIDTASTLAPPNVTEHLRVNTEQGHHIIHQTIISGPGVDVGSLTSICLAVLIVSNIFFTLLFYRAWRKRQKIRREQGTDEEENCRQQQSFVDLLSTKEDKEANVSHYESPYDSIEPEDMYCDGDYVQLRSVDRDHFSTLTTLFKTHSYEVEKTVLKLTTKSPDI